MSELKPKEIPEDIKNQLISNLVEELPVLRTKLGVSQDELGSLVGISRQTYSAIETKRKKMNWSIYLSLIFIFDNNRKTHDFIRKQNLFPNEIFNVSEPDEKEQLMSQFWENSEIKDKLDEQAIHAIETVLMVEYARCNDMTGEAVIKAFSGKRLIKSTKDDIQARKSIKSIRAKSKREEANEQ